MRMNRIWSKFFASYLVVIVLVLAIWATTSSVFIRNHLYKETTQQLMITGDELAQELMPTDLKTVDQAMLRKLGKRFAGQLYLINTNGKYIASTLKVRRLNPNISVSDWDYISSGKKVSWVWEKPSIRENVIAVAVPLFRQKNFSGALVLTSPVRGVEAALTALHYQLLRGGLIALVIGLLLSLAVSYGMTRQIREVSSGVRHFAAEDINYRIPLTTGDELGQIAKSFNIMAEQIARSNERRQLMLAAVSHEVRTPLTNICGYIEALRDGVLPNNLQAETMELIYSESQLLKHMVNDLIDLSRMASDSYELHPSTFEVGQTVARVVRRLDYLALAKKNHVVNMVEPSQKMFGDELRIEQLFNNLIKNALQFTDHGEIRIDASYAGDKFEFSVEDNGIGINPEQLGYVFDSFYKVEPSRSREYEESGLGLAICQAIVKLHKGTISISSTPAQGTRVYISLPQ